MKKTLTILLTLAVLAMPLLVVSAQDDTCRYFEENEMIADAIYDLGGAEGDAFSIEAIAGHQASGMEEWLTDSEVGMTRNGRIFSGTFNIDEYPGQEITGIGIGGVTVCVGASGNPAPAPAAPRVVEVEGNDLGIDLTNLANCTLESVEQEENVVTLEVVCVLTD